MTDMTSDRLGLPLLQQGQAQKEMTHNEALALLDLQVQASAEAIRDVPPEAPESGQCWIVGAAPVDGWAGQAGSLAGWTGGGWRFVAPREGMCVWLERAGGFALFRAGAWRVGEAHGRLFVEGVQVVGTQCADVAEPVGGLTVDVEARAAIVSVLEALRAHGLIGGSNL